MEGKINGLKATVAGAVGLLTGLWGWLGWLVLGWLACMVLDYLTGSAAAGKAGEWSSERAREGIWHKAGMMVVVMVAAGVDLLVGLALAHLPILELPVPYPGLVCPVVLVWYILTELGSITENAVAMGAPVPKGLVKFLAAGRQAADKTLDAVTGGEERHE